jgi:transcriptional/translational regulatory protein YebC/TACO1
VKQNIEKLGLKIETSGLEWVAKSTVNLLESQAEKVYEFLSTVQDHDDVKNVYTNLA